MKLFEYYLLLFWIRYYVITSLIFNTGAFQNRVVDFNIQSQSKVPFRSFIDILTSDGITTWRYDKSHHQIKSFFSLFTTTTNSDSTDTYLLEGKLSILQDVVKEMDLRQKQIKERTKSTNRDYEESLNSVGKELDKSKQITMIQVEQIKDFEKSFLKMEKNHASNVERIQITRDREYEEYKKSFSAISGDRLDRMKEKYESHKVYMEGRLKKKRKEIQELSSEMATKSKDDKNTIDSLQEQVKKQQKELVMEQDEFIRMEKKTEKKETLRVTKEMKSLKDRHQTVVDEYKIKINEISSERDVLLFESDIISKEIDEQVEIATAAVKAAEKREEKIKKASDELTTQLHRSRLQIKIMRLAIDGIVDENKELISKNKKLRHTSNITREQIGEFNEYRDDRKKRNWKELFRFSRKK